MLRRNIWQIPQQHEYFDRHYATHMLTLPYLNTPYLGLASSNRPLYFLNPSLIENVFRVCIAWYKHERGWENSRHLCKPETKSRVCITVENSPNPSSVYIRLCKHRKKVFYCFYKITSSKNYNAGKDEKFILLVKTYLPTTLIWQWDFSTHQSKLWSIKI